MRSGFATRAPSRGFTLVEILVGLVLGMIGIIVMYQVFAVFESQKRTTISGSDAQTTGLLALQQIERDARMGGYGLAYNKALDDVNYEGQVLCTRMSYFPAVTESADQEITRIMPVRIIDGGGASPDQIIVTYSTSSFAATPSTLATSLPSAAAATPTVDNAPQVGASNAVFTPGDYILVGTPAAVPVPITGATPHGVNCMRLQVTGTTPVGTAVTVETAAPGANGANPADKTTIMPTSGYVSSATSPSLTVNMGQFVRNRYRVTNQQLVVNDLTADPTGAGTSIGDQVVAMHAQYGVTQTNCTQVLPAPASSTINCQGGTTARPFRWVNATNNAQGNFADPSPAEIARIKAIRVVVVVRSALQERDAVTGTCTTPGGVVNNGPCAWMDDDATNPAPQIDVSGLPNWQNYRYRVYETIIPLRNVMWANL